MEMSQVTVSHEVTLVTEECITCGVVFGVTLEYQNRRRQYGDRYCCPNGHGQSYSESEADRLRKQLEAEKKKLANAQFEIIAAKQHTEAVEREKKRLQKRIKNGACPCCHRQFSQLSRHMKSKHPEYEES